MLMKARTSRAHLRSARVTTCGGGPSGGPSGPTSQRAVLVLRDEGVRGLQDVLLGAVEQEHGVVPQRAPRRRQRAQHLQQHGAARAVVAGACNTRNTFC